MMNSILNVLIWVIFLVSLYILVFWLVTYVEKRSLFKQEKSKKKLQEYPMVTVGVPAYNEEKTVRATVKSILALKYPHDKLEVILIDDGSKDKTLEIMQDIKAKNPDRNIIIVSHENMGKGASINKAISIAKGKYFACLDADSFVDKNTLVKMLGIYEEDERLAVVTPAMKVRDPKTLVQKLQRLEYITYIFLMRLMGHMDMIYVTPGPFSLYKTSVLRKIGGFAENNLTEDMEMGYRMQKHHYRIRQCFDGYVHTIAPKSIKELYNQRNRWYKGGFINFLSYKKLFMNPKYGDFGMIQMPINLFAYVLGLASLAFTLYYTLNPIIDGLRNLSLISFDIVPYITNFLNMNFSIFDIAFSQYSMMFGLLGFGILLLWMAHRNANEKIRKYGVFQFVPYFFVYFLFLSGIILIGMTQTLLGKKQKW